MQVVPGEDLAGSESGYLRGHGTFLGGGGRLISALVGVVERVDKLVSVRALHARYGGSVGDVVVGRVRSVQAKRWVVDVCARQDAVLQLSAVNIAGGDQRRRTEVDQLHMRTFFAEDDLVSAEVHSVFSDGSLSLHARSLKYGKLENGLLVRVPCCLVRRLKQHFVALPCGVDAIIGMNGCVWLAAATPAGGDGEAAADSGGGGGGAAVANAADAEVGLVEAIERRKRAAAERDVPAEERCRLARARNCVLALARAGLPLLPEAIQAAYDACAAAGAPPEALLDDARAAHAVDAARAVLRSLNAPEQ
jgi:exosome complex component RRP4